MKVTPVNSSRDESAAPSLVQEHAQEQVQSTRTPSTAEAVAPGLGEQRASVLTGDRLCIQCGYNLTGQAVLREPHYDMLIVRCPECATVASIQEYPLLGRWANRWAAALAAAWFLFLAAFWIGSGAALFGLSVAAAELGAQGFGIFLTDRYQVWQIQTMPPRSATQPAAITYSRGINDFDTWWNTQDHAALLAQAGGRIGAIAWANLVYLSPAILVSLILGCFWAVFLLGRQRPGLALWGLAVMAVAAVFCTMAIMAWFAEPSGIRWHGHHTALKALGPGLMIGALIVQAAGLLIGLMIGRSLARGLIRIMLTPRLRSPLAFLWLADGLPPPTSKR